MKRWSEVVAELLEDEQSRLALSARLAAAPHPAFAWETAPVSAATRDRPFAEVVVDSPALARVTADRRAFSEHLAGAVDGVATFSNLGGDAVLIAPAPHPDAPGGYPHLAAFSRTAPAAQISALWLAVARAIEAHWKATEAPLWVSTAGLGVHWLHVRLDRRPKYYRHAPFREPPSM